MNWLRVIDQVVAIGIVTEWIDIIDVGHLDAAYCKHSERSVFLATIASLGATFTCRRAVRNDRSFVEWVVSRHIRLTSLFATHPLEKDQALRSDLLSVVAPTLQTVEFTNCGRTFGQLSYQLNKCREDGPKRGAMLASLGQFGCVRLMRLNLFNTYITNVTLLTILEMNPGLTDLDLSCCRNLTNDITTSIAQYCPQLLSLNLHGALQRPSGEDLLPIANGCKYLRTLNVNFWIFRNDVAWHALATHCTHLRSITTTTQTMLPALAMLVSSRPLIELQLLSELNHADMTALIDVLRCAPHLTSFGAYLYGARAGSDAVLACLPQCCPSLTSLDLSHSVGATDIALCACLTQLTQLRLLALHRCTALMNRTVDKVARSCPHLRYLDLSDCYKVGDKAMLSLARHCPHLTSLDLKHNHLVTEVGLRALARECYWLRDVRYTLFLKMGVPFPVPLPTFFETKRVRVVAEYLWRE